MFENQLTALIFRLLFLAVIASYASSTHAASTDVAWYRLGETDTGALQRTPALTESVNWSGLVTNIAGAWTSPGIVNDTGTNSIRSVHILDSQTNNPAADYRLKYRLKIARP